MDKIKIIKEDTLHEIIVKFMTDEEIKIGEYEDMKIMVLKMISCGFMFNMERDRLRDAMEDLTYMLNPNDDVNKDRVSRGLEYDDDSDEDDIELLNNLEQMTKIVNEQKGEE